MRASVLKRLMEIPDEHLRGILLDVVEELEQEVATREMLAALREDLKEAEKRAESRFNRLEQALAELAEAQKRTEERVEQLSEAQKRTEEALRALAEAQRRTEERVDRLEQRMDRLEQIVAELAEAQKRTEERLNRLEETVEKLAEAQRRTEERLNRLEETVEKLAEQVQRLTQELGVLKDTVRGMKGQMEGERYEWRIVQSARRLLGKGQGGSPMMHEVQRMLDAMITELDVLDAEEDPYLADLIWQKDGVALVVEISVAVNGKDVLRAWKRAETLKRAGVNAKPVVIGERWATEDTKMLAREKDVAWYVEKEFSPELVEIRKIA